MQLPIEVPLGPNLHIGGHTGSTKGSISGLALAKILWSVIGNKHHQIIIAVRARIPACGRAKKINSLGMINLYQSTNDFIQYRVASRWRPRNPLLRVLHDSLYSLPQLS
jgi:hypothetical protein